MAATKSKERCCCSLQGGQRKNGSYDLLLSLAFKALRLSRKGKSHSKLGSNLNNWPTSIYILELIWTMLKFHSLFSVLGILWTSTYTKWKRRYNSKPAAIHKLLWKNVANKRFKISTSVSVFKNSRSGSSTQFQYGTVWRSGRFMLFAGIKISSVCFYLMDILIYSLVYNPNLIIWIVLNQKYYLLVYGSSAVAPTTICIWMVFNTSRRPSILSRSWSSSPVERGC